MIRAMKDVVKDMHCNRGEATFKAGTLAQKAVLMYRSGNPLRIKIFQRD
jgi:hypothetical protein